MQAPTQLLSKLRRRTPLQPAPAERPLPTAAQRQLKGLRALLQHCRQKPLRQPLGQGKHRLGQTSYREFATKDMFTRRPPEKLGPTGRHIKDLAPPPRRPHQAQAARPRARRARARPMRREGAPPATSTVVKPLPKAS